MINLLLFFIRHRKWMVFFRLFRRPERLSIFYGLLWTGGHKGFEFESLTNFMSKTLCACVLTFTLFRVSFGGSSGLAMWSHLSPAAGETQRA